MRSVDAEHVAEELVRLFSRVGIPKEILTDQGTNFACVPPYHPQTDGMVKRNIKGDAAEMCYRRWKGLGPSSTVCTLCLPGGSARINRILAFRATIRTGDSRTSRCPKRGMGNQVQQGERNLTHYAHAGEVGKYVQPGTKEHEASTSSTETVV